MNPEYLLNYSISCYFSGRMVHLHMHHQVQHLDRFGPGNRSSSPVIPPKSIFLDSTTCPIHTAEAHHQVKGIDKNFLDLGLN